jgi:hypothetical protein
VGAEFGLYYPPWNYTGKADDLFGRVAGEVGIDHVTIPVVTGEQTQFRLNRLRDEPYFHTEGGWHFPPREELYKGGVRPPTAAWFGKRDVVARICERGRNLGLAVYFRVHVPSVRRLTKDASLRRRNAWAQDIGALPACPCNPELRELTRATLVDLTRYDPVGFQVPNWSQAEPSPREDTATALRWLSIGPDLRLCFCASCRQAAAGAGVDPDQAARSIRTRFEWLGARQAGATSPEWVDKDDVPRAYESARAADYRDWLDRLGEVVSGRRCFCVQTLALPEASPANWTRYCDGLAVHMDEVASERPLAVQVATLEATAAAVQVASPDSADSSGLVRLVSGLTTAHVSFLDFKGIEEAPAEAVTRLKQAVRYARRG